MQRMAGREHVSDATDCHNRVPVLAKLASQVTDVDIDRAVERRRHAAAYRLRQLISRHDLASLARQVLDNVVLHGGTGDDVAVHGDGARRRIDAQSPGAAPLTVVLNWTAAFSR